MPFENLKKQHISDINEINDRIINEICYNTINELSDNKLINEYKKCKSVIKEIKLLENILLHLWTFKMPIFSLYNFCIFLPYFS